MCMFKAQDQGISAQTRATAASNPSQALLVRNTSQRNISIVRSCPASNSGSISNSLYQLPSTSQPVISEAQVIAPKKRRREASSSNSGVKSIKRLDVDARSRIRRTEALLKDGNLFEYERNSFTKVINTVPPNPTLQSLNPDQQTTSTSTNPAKLQCPYCPKNDFRDKSKLDDHLRSHSGKRPFLCPKNPICRFRYKYKRDQTEHWEKKCKFNIQPARGDAEQALSPHRVSNNIDSQSQHTSQSELLSPTIAIANANDDTIEYSSPLLLPGPQLKPSHGDPLTGVGTQEAVQLDAHAQIWHPPMDEDARRVRDSRSERIEKAISVADQVSRQIDFNLERELEYYRSWVDTDYPKMSQLCSYFGVQANASAAQPTSIAPSPAQNVQQPGPRYSSILPNPQAPPHCQYPRFYPHRVSNSVGPQSQQTPQSESPSSSNAHSPSATNENTNSFQLSTRNNPLNRSAQSNLGEGTSQAFYINRHPPVQSVISVATQVLDVDDDSVAKRRFGFWPNPSVEIPLDPHHYPHGTSNCVIPQSQHSPQSESPSSNAHSSNATNGNPNPFQLSTRNTPLNRSAQSNLGEGASQAFYINRHPPVQSVISVATQVLDVDDDSVVKRRFGFRPNPSVEIPPDPQSPNNYPHGTSNCAIPQSQHSPQSESPSSNAHITSATNEDPTLLQPSLQNRHTQSNLDGGASQAPIIHRHMPLQSDISAATQLQQWDIDDGGFEAEWRNYFWPET